MEPRDICRFVALIEAIDVEADPGQYLQGDLVDDDINGELETLASGAFITDEGRCNATNMAFFTKQTGWRIGPGEQDSFGWLTGVIYTPKGMFVYG